MQIPTQAQVTVQMPWPSQAFAISCTLLFSSSLLFSSFLSLSRTFLFFFVLSFLHQKKKEKNEPAEAATAMMSRGAATGTATAMSFGHWLHPGSNVRGVLRGKQYHEDDFDSVLQRGWDAGVREIIITAGSLREQEALSWPTRIADCALL